jgi:hypothetical protein
MFRWSRSGTPVDLLPALRGRIAFLTNNLIRPKPPQPRDLLQQCRKLLDVAHANMRDDVYDLLSALKKALPYEEPEPVHRQDFIEVQGGQ